MPFGYFFLNYLKISTLICAFSFLYIIYNGYFDEVSNDVNVAQCYIQTTGMVFSFAWCFQHKKFYRILTTLNRNLKECRWKRILLTLVCGVCLCLSLSLFWEVSSTIWWQYAKPKLDNHFLDKVVSVHGEFDTQGYNWTSPDNSTCVLHTKEANKSTLAVHVPVGGLFLFSFLHHYEDAQFVYRINSETPEICGHLRNFYGCSKFVLLYWIYARGSEIRRAKNMDFNDLLRMLLYEMQPPVNTNQNIVHQVLERLWEYPFFFFITMNIYLFQSDIKIYIPPFVEGGRQSSGPNTEATITFSFVVCLGLEIYGLHRFMFYENNFVTNEHCDMLEKDEAFYVVDLWVLPLENEFADDSDTSCLHNNNTSLPLTPNEAKYMKGMVQEMHKQIQENENIILIVVSIAFWLISVLVVYVLYRIIREWYDSFLRFIIVHPDPPVAPRPDGVMHDFYLTCSEADERHELTQFVLRCLELMGYRTFFTARDIPPNLPVLSSAERAIDSCRRYILLVTRFYLEDDYGMNIEAPMIVSTASSRGNLASKVLVIKLENCSIPRWMSQFTVLDWTDRDYMHFHVLDLQTWAS